MSSARSAKDKAMASHLRELGVTRSSGQCPMGCGKAIVNGGTHLTIHLPKCKGLRKR